MSYEHPTNINIIPQSSEKYLSFDIGRHLRFIDSFTFLSTSLDTLVENLKKGNEEEENLKKNFSHTYSWFHQQGYSFEQIKLLFSKAPFPYEYMDNFSKFDEKCLPPMHAFNSSLTGKQCSLVDYEKAQKIWTTFKCESMENYQSLYVSFIC